MEENKKVPQHLEYPGKTEYSLRIASMNLSLLLKMDDKELSNMAICQCLQVDKTMTAYM